MSIKVTTLPDGKLCDFIDQKIRNDTPEEYVRQNIERRLVLELGFKPSQIAVEFRVQVGSSSRRVDLALFAEGDEHSQDNIWIVVECKKDSVEPKSQKDGVDQLKSYLSACPNAEWGMWTNGKFKAVYRKVMTPRGIVWEEPNDIPSASGDLDEVDRPSRDSLKHATDDNLLFAFRTCHNHIYVTDGLQKQPAFFEFLKVIFCKILDERSLPRPLDFYAAAKEKMSPDGRLTVANRVEKIFAEVKARYPTIFHADDRIRLQPRSLAYVVGELQRYGLLETHIDVKGKAYEELVGANLRGDRGEFFTPRNVQRMAIRMLDIQVDDRVLDPACGTGGFLIIAMNSVIDQLHDRSEIGSRPSLARLQAVSARVQEIASRNFFGVDINPDLVKATKMNMVMNNDGAGNILRQDSLLHPHQWEAEFRQDLASALGISDRTLTAPDRLGYFDVVATNPPFGSKLPIKDRETLAQFELGHVWVPRGDRLEPTDEIVTAAPPEILFIERCWQFLKPGGRLAIVLPNAILGAPSLAYVRQWILNNCRLIASVDLHPDTFQPRNGTRTSVLVLQRKTPSDLLRETRQGGVADYEVFMAQVHAIGHDKRGKTVYRRNKDGEELLFPVVASNAVVLDRTATGDASIRTLRRQKVIDDDTPQIADEFLEWKTREVLGW